MTASADTVLLPDAGPLITLAYADALDLLFKPGWAVVLVDMVFFELTRNQTPTSERLAEWVEKHRLLVERTNIHDHYQRALLSGESVPGKAHLGELAIQETMNSFAIQPPKTGVFLFEEHKIARASFVLPDNCHKVSTRSFLLFLEQKGWLASAMEIERKAILAGRAFSHLRFPA